MLYLIMITMTLIMSIIIKLYLYPNKNDNFLKRVTDLFLKQKITLFIDVFLFIIYFLIYRKYGFSSLFFSNIILMSILLTISIMDIKMKIIPNNLVISGIILGTIMVFLNNHISIISALLGCTICGGLIAIISFITRGSIGMGDAKLFACIGIFLGLHMTLGILIVATILSGLIGLYLLIFKKADRKTLLPFAPYIFAATIFMMVFN
ncbi:Flp pilus assembly protein, protease CpaA [Paramaledivibacter caminithermalis DSM 15212]|uniref:Flp pilus assembly protein, protease CpaA n=2 Tax=Paramaledivibacter TaxID=1884934 RepID=A0A1M6PI08_PARC5|nr:Flp pilus assembly protein, protease CpaA [Paramaledivibacter caminithermalis DSM 15212]